MLPNYVYNFIIVYNSSKVKSFLKIGLKSYMKMDTKKRTPLSRGMSVWKQEDVYGSMKFLKPLATARWNLFPS